MVATAVVGIICTFLAFAVMRPLVFDWGHRHHLATGWHVLRHGLWLSLQATYMTTTRDTVTATQSTIEMTLGNGTTWGGTALTPPFDALFESRSIFLCVAVPGMVPLVLLYFPPISEKDEPTTESTAPQNPS